jgi:hypothetical protein
MQQASLGYNLLCLAKLPKSTNTTKTNFCWICVPSKKANDEDNNQSYMDKCE